MTNRNLIRFDWAIKRLLRNKADFYVLEGFLSELLKEDISIENILESESNQQIESDKFNRVDILKLSAKQTELLGGKIEPFQIFPEYYVIKVNKFDDVAKDTLDEWIYYLKNNEIKDEFTAKGIEKAKELWRVDKLSEDEQKNYFRHIEDLRYGASMAWTMKVDAEDRVKKQKAIEIARTLLEKGISKDIIKDSTGLSDSEIDEL
ncbi:hypothetical protein [Plebeiibacterium marinum]|uniref:PD-(D/E)XK nuclease family transposase n=1 Tax=Plebeiibacterium marinum TaxID=2992111 RepID=A0AAE3MHN9_9BACT|nr:hypothetical protein [Plebeiobacterium marinum]MCW3808033.1 hypothetical protein [Plebeiobacterium marinum]